MDDIVKVILSFDDGRKDNYDIVVPILKKYNLTATFNIATAYVDGSIDAENRPCLNEAMTIDEVIDLYNQGFEIAAHGDCHKNDIVDIKNGIEKLRKWGVIGDNIGFASPNSRLPATEIKKNEDIYRGLGISYIRVGVRKNSILSKVQRKFSEKIGNKFFYCRGFNCAPMELEKDFVVYSVPVMHNARLRQVKGVVKQAIIQKSDCVLMFHSVLNSDSPYYVDTWTWDRRRFDELCAWLKELEIQMKIRVGNDTKRGLDIRRIGLT